MKSGNVICVDNLTVENRKALEILITNLFDPEVINLTRSERQDEDAQEIE